MFSYELLDFELMWWFLLSLQGVNHRVLPYQWQRMYELEEYALKYAHTLDSERSELIWKARRLLNWVPKWRHQKKKMVTKGHWVADWKLKLHVYKYRYFTNTLNRRFIALLFKIYGTTLEKLERYSTESRYHSGPKAGIFRLYLGWYSCLSMQIPHIAGQPTEPTRPSLDKSSCITFKKWNLFKLNASWAASCFYLRCLEVLSHHHIF